MQNFDDKNYILEIFRKIFQMSQDFNKEINKFITTVDQEKILLELEKLGAIPEELQSDLRRQYTNIVTNSTKLFDYTLTVQEGFYTAVDALIFYYNIQANSIDGLIIINRPGSKLAPIGGFTKYGETSKESAIREAHEEVNINVDMHTLSLLDIYENLDRDPRNIQVTSIAYIGLTSSWPEISSEAKEVFVMTLDQIKQTKAQDWFAKDHKEMAIAAFKKLNKQKNKLVKALIKYGKI